jgi:hypothetical protein
MRKFSRPRWRIQSLAPKESDIVVKHLRRLTVSVAKSVHYHWNGLSECIYKEELSTRLNENIRSQSAQAATAAGPCVADQGPMPLARNQNSNCIVWSKTVVRPKVVPARCFRFRLGTKSIEDDDATKKVSRE